MVTNYFRDLRYSESVTSGFYILEDASTPYYICAYKDRELGKDEIVSALQCIPGYGHLTAGDFDFHHIVERQHLADVSFSGQLALEYENLPTAMIHKGEHRQYNSILHVKESRLLYLRDAINPAIKKGSWSIREKATVELFGSGLNTGGMQELSNRIKILREIYAAVYEKNEVFKLIASNILNEYSRNLTIV